MFESVTLTHQLRLSNPRDWRTFKEEIENERVRMILNKDEYKSIFGNTNTESVMSEILGNLSVISSKASSK